MSTKLTRRQAALALTSSAVLLAQSPAPAALPSNPQEELKAAQDSLQRTYQQLAKFNLPMATEPAVHFKA